MKNMTPERWAWGLALVTLMGVIVAARPKEGTAMAAMLLVGILIYQQRHKTGIWG